MSSKERRRLEMLSRVRDGEITLARAAPLMEVSYRQAKRLKARYDAEGDAGLTHGLRGQPSNRGADLGRRERVLGLYRAKYWDYGPTLAVECMALEDGEAVGVETLRRWLIAADLWETRKRRGHKHRQWRERRAHAGEMVQMDGSDHLWFEDRAPREVLMVMVDDATNTTYARFNDGETTVAAFETFRRYVDEYGLPQSLYVDRDSIYVTTRSATIDEALAAEPPLTQFGRAMSELGVGIILAHSPQAKGRVERRNGILQDRLVKALRRRGICETGPANRFLEKEYLPAFNRQFRVPAREPADMHRSLPAGVSLDRVLSFQEARVVRSDWTISWCNRWFQLTAGDHSLALAGSRVLVLEQMDGSIHISYRGRELSCEELPERPRPAPRPPRTPVARQPQKPGPDHPWRRRFLPEREATSAVLLGGVSPGQPPRSLEC